MDCFVADPEVNGLEVLDLREDAEFARRTLHDRDMAKQMKGVQRLVHAFIARPETILQELVEAAVELCGADSAGISVVKEDYTDENFYRWVATAGRYSAFLDATLPRYPSACGVCLERGRPQHFRVNRRFFDIMGIEAPLVRDGILLPWEVEESRGTIFIMAHDRDEAFDVSDVRMMQMLSDCAAMAVQHQRQQQELVSNAKAIAAAEMANKLAHEINNPLQGLINMVYLAAEGLDDSDARSLAQAMSVDLLRLSTLVQRLLALHGSPELIQ